MNGWDVGVRADFVWIAALVGAVLFLAGLVHLAVLRDRGIRELHLAESLRWLIVVGLFSQAVRIGWALASTGLWHVSAHALANWALVGTGLLGHGLMQLCDRRRQRVIDRMDRRHSGDRRKRWRPVRKERRKSQGAPP